MRLQELPLDAHTRRAMVRRHSSVVKSRRQASLRNWHLVTNRFDGIADVHFTPLSVSSPGHGVIMVFQVDRGDKSPGGAKPGNTQPAKKKIKQLASKKKK